MTYVPGRSLPSAEMHLLGNNVRGVVLRDRCAARAQDFRNEEEPYASITPDDDQTASDEACRWHLKRRGVMYYACILWPPSTDRIRRHIGNVVGGIAVWPPRHNFAAHTLVSPRNSRLFMFVSPCEASD